MALPDPIGVFLEPLEKAELTYCVTGSVAAGIYGEPRMTRAIDLVLLLQPAAVATFRACFDEADFYVPPAEILITEAMRDARGSFNLVHHRTGFKADVYLAGRDALQAWALQNRRRAELGSGTLWLAPPEYVLLRKLEFFREGGQEKHLRDVRALLACTGVNRTFLEAEVARLGLGEQWAACAGGGGAA